LFYQNDPDIGKYTDKYDFQKKPEDKCAFGRGKPSETNLIALPMILLLDTRFEIS